MKQLMDGVWHLRSIPYDESFFGKYTDHLLVDEFEWETCFLKATSTGDHGWRRYDYSIPLNRESSGAVWHIDNPGNGGTINSPIPGNYMIIAPLCQRPFEKRGTLIRDGMGFIIEASPWNMYLIRWNISHKGPEPHFGPRLIKRHYLWIKDRWFDNNYTEEYVEPRYADS